MAVDVTRIFLTTRVACARSTDQPTASALSTRTCANTSKELRRTVALHTLRPWRTKRTSSRTLRTASMTSSAATRLSSVIIRTCWTLAYPFQKAMRFSKMVVCSAIPPRRCKGPTKTCITGRGARRRMRWAPPCSRRPPSCQRTPTSSSTIV